MPPANPRFSAWKSPAQVERIGAEATGFKEGDRVFGLIGSGGYAEQTVIDYRMAMPIPEGWSFEQAAAVPRGLLYGERNAIYLRQVERR